jgi:hypothetical protein
MAGIVTPPVIVEPFAVNAAPANITLPIPVASQIGTTPGAASYNDGFPPDTMIPVVAGGIPPFGQDFNGILYTVTASIAAMQAGQPWLYNTTIVAAIGGYPVGTILANADGSGLWINTIAANVTDPDGSNPSGWVSFVNIGIASVSGLTIGTVFLTPAQYKKPVIFLTGALTGNVAIVLPANEGQQWLIANGCTGAFTVFAESTALAGSVVIPPGGSSSPTGVYCDGANILPSTAPLAVPISVAANPSTLVERDNGGNIFAAFLNQNSALDTTTVMGSVFCNASTNDGFLRKVPFANFIAQLGLATMPQLPTTGSNANGRWIKYANGVIDQWGVKAGGGAGPVTVTFPMPFASACESIVATACGVQATIETSLPGASKNSFQLTNGAAGSSTSWRASGI